MFLHMENGRKELGINGCSDLIDLGTFRLIRRSSEEPLGLVYHWLCIAIEVSMHIRACTIPAFQGGKEELPNANFQLGK